MGICIRQSTWAFNYAIYYGPIREWAFIFAKLRWVVNYSTNYGPICKWTFIFAKLLWLLSMVQIMDPFMNGHPTLCKL